MATKEAKAVELEKELKKLKYELKILKEAKPLSDACKSISEFTQKDYEPFSTSHVEPNEFHKKVAAVVVATFCKGYVSCAVCLC